LWWFTACGLPQLLKARKLPIETLAAEALGIRPETQFRTLGLRPPPARAAGRRLDSVTALGAALAQRGLP